MKLRAVALAALMVFSIIAGSAALSGSAAAAPSGFVSVADSQVTSDLPTNTPMGEAAQDIADAGVMSSAHADSLEVIVTSPGRAKNVIDGGEIHGSGPISIVLTDDENSEGRTVALPAAEVEDALGYTPEMARGTHEDGTPWASEIEIQDGWLLVEVPHFSTNTVTFAGQVSIQATPASSGSAWSYNISDLDAVDNFTINVTGSTAKAWANETQTNLATGGSATTDPSGSADPEGPSASDNPTIDVSVPFEHDSASLTGLDGGKGIAIDGNHAFVTGDFSDTFHVVDISDPSNMEQTGLYDGGNDNLDRPHGVAVTNGGDTAAVTRKDNNKFSIFDVADRSADPVYVSNQSTNTYPYGVVADPDTSGIVYVSTAYYGTLEVYNVSDPANPTESGSVSPAAVDDLRGLDYQSGYIYGANPDSNQTAVFNVSDPANPSLAGSVNDPVMDSARDITVAGDYAYVPASNGNSLTVVDVTDPTNPTIAGSVTDDSALYQAKGVAVNGSKAYVETDEGLTIVDVSSPSSPAIVNHYDSGNKNRVYGVAVDDGKVFWTYNSGLKAITEYESASSISVDADDGTSATIGDLETGDTTTAEFPLSTSATAIDITGSGAAVDYTLRMKEVTETVDPTVDVNGNTTSYTGTLANGEETSLSVDPAWIKEGQNNVSIAVSESYKPTGEAVLDYDHDAQDDQSVEYQAEKFSERYNVSKTFASDRVNPTLTIPFADTALSMRNLEYQVNDGGWQTLSDYSLDNTTLTANLPDVSAEDSVDVRATASKVAVQDGEIKVLEPTTVEDPLDSEIEITNPGDNFAIDVSGIDEQSVHYLANVDYTDADPYALIDDAGNQEVYAPQATHGATVRVRSLPLWASPANDVEIHVQDGDVPEFTVKPGPTTGDFVEIEYRNTVTGTKYVLWDLTNDREADADTAQSPVTFTITDETLTYEIFDSSSSGSGAGPISSSDSGTFPIILIGAVVLGIAGLLLVIRGLGGFGGGRTGRSDSRLPSWLPSLSSASGGSRSAVDDSTSRTIALGGLLIIGLVALELATPDALYQTLLATGGALGGTAVQEMVTVALGIGALLGLWFLDQRTTEAIPTWMMAIAAVVMVVYIMETIQPGVLLGPASSGFETISPLFWLVVVVGGAYFAYGYIQSRREPDTNVTFQLGDRNK